MTEQITRSIIVKSDVATAFNAWANFENFPHFMKNIKSVHTTGPNMSHWEMNGPGGVDIEWDAETTRMEPNKRIAWSSKESEDSDIVTSGQVTFNDLPQGQTEVTVMMQYVARKGGRIGQVIAEIFANPEKQLEEDLSNFKQYIESRAGYTG